MMSSRLAAAAFGAILMAGAGLAAAPAGAAPVAQAPVHAAQSGEGLVQQAWHRGRPHYGHRRYYGRPVYRPRCRVVDRRVWNGYRWVIRTVRVCR